MISFSFFFINIIIIFIWLDAILTRPAILILVALCSFPNRAILGRGRHFPLPFFKSLFEFTRHWEIGIDSHFFFFFHTTKVFSSP